MAPGVRYLVQLGIAVLCGMLVAALAVMLVQAQSPTRYQSRALLYLPPSQPPQMPVTYPDREIPSLPAVNTLQSAAEESLVMGDYALLAASEAVAERIAPRLAEAAEAAGLDTGPYTAARIQGRLSARAKPLWSGVYQVIYQRVLELHATWDDGATSALLATIWAEEAADYLNGLGPAEGPRLVPASKPTAPGAPVGVGRTSAIGAAALLGGLLALLLFVGGGVLWRHAQALDRD